MVENRCLSRRRGEIILYGMQSIYILTRKTPSHKTIISIVRRCIIITTGVVVGRIYIILFVFCDRGES